MAMKPKKTNKKSGGIPCASCPNPERCMKMGVCMKKAAYK
jgi:hypothetical protein